MKKTLLMLLCLFTFPLLVACSNASITSEQPKPPKVASDKKTCLEQQGAWMRVGLLGHYMCVFKASDAGKTCSDSKECEYRCLATSPFTPKESKKVTGTCQATNNPFGCSSEVMDGVAQPALCID